MLGGYAEQLLGSPRFFDARWLNSSKTAKAWRTEVDAAVDRARDDIEFIQRSAEFCKGYRLVGHNVKSCDIPHIARAAKRAGVALENEYFDSYRYAKRFEQEQGWENVKLEYLSKQFGLEHGEAHRAWCDAQANVGVFEQLKKLGA